MKKTRKGFEKKLVKDPKKNKTKSTDILIGNTKIFLKKKKKKSVNIVVNNMKISKRMNIETKFSRMTKIKTGKV